MVKTTGAVVLGGLFSSLLQIYVFFSIFTVFLFLGQIKEEHLRRVGSVSVVISGGFLCVRYTTYPLSYSVSR